MTDFIGWFAKEENAFFTIHAGGVFVLAVLVEAFAPIWTTISYPALILFAAASFIYNYPVKAIKNHGLFAEYLIELRLLWLVIFGLLFEFLTFRFFETGLTYWMAVAGVVAGLLVALFARSRLQEKIIAARGFK